MKDPAVGLVVWFLLLLVSTTNRTVFVIEAKLLKGGGHHHSFHDSSTRGVKLNLKVHDDNEESNHRYLKSHKKSMKGKKSAKHLVGVTGYDTNANVAKEKKEKSFKGKSHKQKSKKNKKALLSPPLDVNNNRINKIYKYKTSFDGLEIVARYNEGVEDVTTGQQNGIAAVGLVDGATPSTNQFFATTTTNNQQQTKAFKEQKSWKSKKSKKGAKSKSHKKSKKNKSKKNKEKGFRAGLVNGPAATTPVAAATPASQPVGGTAATQQPQQPTIQKGKRYNEEMRWSMRTTPNGFQVLTQYKNSDTANGIKVRTSIETSTFKLVEFVKNNPNDDNEVYVNQPLVNERIFQNWQTASFDGCTNNDITTTNNNVNYYTNNNNVNTNNVNSNNNNNYMYTYTSNNNQVVYTPNTNLIQPTTTTTSNLQSYTKNSCTGRFTTLDGCLTVIAKANLPATTTNTITRPSTTFTHTNTPHTTYNTILNNRIQMDPDDVKFDYIFGDHCVVSSNNHGLALIGKVRTDSRVQTKPAPNVAATTTTDASGFAYSTATTGGIQANELNGIEVNPDDNQGVSLFLTWLDEVDCKGFPTKAEAAGVTASTTLGGGGRGLEDFGSLYDAAISGNADGTNYISNYFGNNGNINNNNNNINNNNNHINHIHGINNVFGTNGQTTIPTINNAATTDVSRRINVYTYNDVDAYGREQDNQKVIHWTINQKPTDRQCIWDPVIGAVVYDESSSPLSHSIITALAATVIGSCTIVWISVVV